MMTELSAESPASAEQYAADWLLSGYAYAAYIHARAAYARAAEPSVLMQAGN